MESKSNNFNLLRLLFAAFVVYTHSFAVLGLMNMNPVRGILVSTWLSKIGVNGFFLISGFLITRSMAQGSIVYYTISRVLRIYPALLFSTAVTILVMFFFSDLNFKDYILHSQTIKFFIGNTTLFKTVVGLLPGVFEDHLIKVVNVSLWTLVVELRMYLIIGILGVLGVIRHPFIAKCVLIVLLVLLLSNYGPDVPLVHDKDNWTRVSMHFFWGALIYFFRYEIPIDWRLFIASVLMFLWLQGKPGYDQLSVLPFSYIVFWLGLGFVWKDPINIFGDLSYGLYIYSFPVQQIFRNLWPNINVYLHIILSLILAGMAAYCSWWLIEARALRLKKFFAPQLKSLSFKNRPGKSEKGGGLSKIDPICRQSTLLR